MGAEDKLTGMSPADFEECRSELTLDADEREEFEAGAVARPGDDDGFVGMGPGVDYSSKGNPYD